MIKLKDIIRESKQLNLFEQSKIYKSHEMRGSFMANYVTPNAGWKEDFAPIIKNIQDLLNQGYKLDQINVVIKSGASPATASNRYEGANPPKHNFERYIPTGTPTGGLLPPAGWVPATGIRVEIPNGNAFLAAERGRQLKARIEPLLKSKFPELPSNFIIMDPKLNSEQFASYQVQTKGEKSPAIDINNITFGAGYNDPRVRGVHMIWAANKTGVSSGELSDFGRGKGVSVYLTKELAQQLFKLDPAGEKIPPSLGRFGGDPVDYELDLWNYFKNTPGYESNAANQEKFAYVDVKTGKFLNNVQRPLVYDKTKKNSKGRVDYALANPPNPDPRKQIQ